MIDVIMTAVFGLIGLVLVGVIALREYKAMKARHAQEIADEAENKRLEEEAAEDAAYRAETGDDIWTISATPNEWDDEFPFPAPKAKKPKKAKKSKSKKKAKKA